MLRTLVDTIREYAIIMLDPKGQIMTWSPAAEQLKGYRAEEMVGKHFSTFYTREDLANGKADRELETAVRDGRSEDEGWRVRKDGTKFWANVVITALRDAQGSLKGFGKVSRDLTDRREAEERVKKQAQEILEMATVPVVQVLGRRHSRSADRNAGQRTHTTTDGAPFATAHGNQLARGRDRYHGCTGHRHSNRSAPD
jgi:PAS domain S-box-containing protein